ncbi:hypothetical protein Psuf_054150 [Phytohabitans suffuscus]|uniref:Uncharacterized protein n=1 Tax=Phytohabitans suffuscus TaxID=624315 RepID=A0A6F8YPQ2_9ACTN|nr:hypothetical protein Psuf_054150 [Phytohabitans suffuscus]
MVTEYARNITNPAWLLSPVKRVHGWADDCATPPTAANQVTTDTKFTLDNLAYGAAPTKGAITKVETIKDWNGGTRLYQTTATTVYDAQGRVKSVTDIAGETTTTDYTPAAGDPSPKPSPPTRCCGPTPSSSTPPGARRRKPRTPTCGSPRPRMTRWAAPPACGYPGAARLRSRTPRPADTRTAFPRRCHR